MDETPRAASAAVPCRDTSLPRFVQAPRPAGGYPARPFASDVRAGKGTSFYRAHTYHTKVPPQGIETFIAYYTRPGQVVLDPFCGSGMTGIAAVMQGRRAVLCDLSPAAAFFALNHCRGLDVDAFLRAGHAILRDTERDWGWLYATRPRAGLQAPLDPDALSFERMIWSQALLCPACGARYSLWDAALGADRKVLAEYPCAGCGVKMTKKKSTPAGIVPVRVDFAPGPCGQAAPDDADLRLVEKIGSMPWPAGLWHPRTPIPREADEIRRLHNDGIATIDGLFTRRNLLCLAALWQRAVRSDPALRPSLMFAVTGIMQRASRLNKFIPSLNISPGPILGTMYIPGFYPETNALHLFRRKLEHIARCHRGLPPDRDGAVRVSRQSAADLSNIPDESIDYVFTDPPFGSNIQYSELNLLWESWLGTLTDASEEAVVSRSQGKGVSEYRELMARSFSEMRRVLKPGAWLTLVFHNSSGEIWAAIQDALAEAGFAAGSIRTFDKAHDTFKMVTAPGAVGYDVVVNCRKGPAPARRRQALAPADLAAACEFVRGHLAQLSSTDAMPGRARPNARRLHSLAIAHFMQAGRPIGFDFAEFRHVAEEELRNSARG